MLTKEVYSLTKKLLVVINPHAKDHLNNRQRAVFGDDELRKIIKKTPISVEQQVNKRFKVTYREPDGVFDIIFAQKNNKLEVVTFIKVKQYTKKGLKR